MFLQDTRGWRIVWSVDFDTKPRQLWVVGLRITDLQTFTVPFNLKQVRESTRVFFFLYNSTRNSTRKPPLSYPALMQMIQECLPPGGDVRLEQKVRWSSHDWKHTQGSRGGASFPEPSLWHQWSSLTRQTITDLCQYVQKSFSIPQTIPHLQALDTVAEDPLNHWNNTRRQTEYEQQRRLWSDLMVMLRTSFLVRDQ